ncbi:hypothetical protein FOA52_009022 [Chlamydomonas sp. UWO 241]|nr:hypothetical protein FOA52_009022 [Chlamydomonas sp. UWO 241]
MSAAREVKQLVERLLQLTDGGLVVAEGNGEDPMLQAIWAVQLMVDALEQQVEALQPQQGEEAQQGGAPRATGGLKFYVHNRGFVLGAGAAVAVGVVAAVAMGVAVAVSMAVAKQVAVAMA